MRDLQRSALDIFEGPGEMRARCREFDWASTPLGPVDGWSPTLRTAVQMVLASGLPNIILWGRELIHIYNDSYSRIIGAKHPEALGRGNRETWPEVWHINGPIYERVFAGETVVLEDELYPLERGDDAGRRVRVDAYLTVAFSPIRDEAGEIAGVLANMLETTSQVELRRLQAEREVLLRALQVEQNRLAEVFRQAPAFLAVLRGPDLVFELVNEAYENLIGPRDVIGRPLFEALPEVRGQGFEALLAAVLESGQAYIGREMPILISRSPGAPPEQRYLDFSYLPLVESDGTPSGIIAHGTDVTEHVLARREIERARADAEAQFQRFRRVQDASPDGFVLAHAIRDANGVLRDFEYGYANPAADRLTTGVGGGLAGRRMLDVFPTITDAGLFERYAAVLAGGPSFQTEIEYSADGLDAAYRISAVRVSADELAISFSDISERVRLLAAERAALGQARAARDHLERVISQAPVSMYIARGREHVFEVVNAAWCEIVHRRPEEVIGRSVREVFPEVASQGICELVERVYDTGEAYAEGAQRILLDGDDGLTEHFFNIVYQPLRNADGAVYAMAVVATEVTELVQARREAERALGVAENANRAKSEFLAVMSHELRTPLNAIAGYVELLGMGVRGPVTPAQRQDLDRIQRSQQHLLGLINEVLNYAKLETGNVRFDLTDVRVCAAITAVEPFVLPQAHARRLTLDASACDADHVVRADREKLQQILVNLLSNAVKFTEPGGRVTVSSRANGRTIAIEVEDSGIGIPPDKLESIFEPFVQVGRALNRPGEGTGLGLAISRDLARGMGGDLSAASVVGSGSTFTLTLPRG